MSNTLDKCSYYRIFMYFYSLCLRLPDFVMVNSSWTQNHINSILLDYQDPALSFIHSIFPPLLKKKIIPKAARIVYPPCPTHDMVKMPLENRWHVLLSIAQFRLTFFQRKLSAFTDFWWIYRPEKDHKAQLYAVADLLQRYPEHQANLRIVMIGGSRNDADAERVKELQVLAKELGIEVCAFREVSTNSS